MKTTINAFALLFAAISFTACTNQSIEPVRPATRPSSVVRTDTIETVHIVPEKADQAERPGYYGLETLDEEPSRKPYQQPPVITPSPQPMPSPAVMPVLKSDTLAQY